MRTRIATVPAAALLAVSTLSACGPDSKASSTNSTSASASDAASASASSSAKPIDCPTENTRSFAKTRFVTDIGLTAGTFHRYIWKPYQAGTFKKGADGRVKAMIKGGATAALDYKLMSNAVKNAQANPTLCKTIAQPLATAVESLKNMKGDIASGNFGSIALAETALSQIMSGSQKNGIKVDETTDESKASQG